MDFHRWSLIIWLFHEGRNHRYQNPTILGGLRITSLPIQTPRKALLEQILQGISRTYLDTCNFKANPASFHTSLLLVDWCFSFCDGFDLLVGGHLTPVADVFQFVSAAKQLWYLQILQLLWKKPAVCATPVPMGVVGPTTVKWKVVRSQKKVAPDLSITGSLSRKQVTEMRRKTVTRLGANLFKWQVMANMLLEEKSPRLQAYQYAVCFIWKYIAIGCYTLPVTNITPENRVSQNETSNHPFSGAMLVLGRVVRIQQDKECLFTRNRLEVDSPNMARK